MLNKTLWVLCRLSLGAWIGNNLLTSDRFQFESKENAYYLNLLNGFIVPERSV